MKILDFGIAKVASAPSLTKTGVMKGKIGYMAPEQVTNRNVDRRADVFAVGVMLWEAIARRRLVEVGTNEVAALQARLTGDIPLLRTLAPDAPEELVSIAEKALALSPDERYATAEDMQNAIEEYLRSSSNPQPRDIGKLVREAFATERTALKRTVEEQLSQPSTSLPMVQLPDSNSFSPRPAPSATPEPRTMTGAIDVEITQLAPSPKPGARRAGLLVGLGTVAVALVGIALLRRPNASPQAAPSTPVEGTKAASTGAPARPSAEPATVTVTVDVKPKDATVTLDGAPVTLPLTRPADARTRHELSVSAPGHKASTRELVFDRGQTTPFADRAASMPAFPRS